MEKKSAVYIFKSCVHLFDTQSEVEEAIGALRDSGFNVKKLSLVTRGYHASAQSTGFYSMDNQIRIWGGAGNSWDGIWAELLVPEVILLPEIGFVAMAGPLVFALVTALESAVGDEQQSTAFGNALIELGIAIEQSGKYQVALKSNTYVLMIHGTQIELEQADQLLAMSKSSENMQR